MKGTSHVLGGGGVYHGKTKYIIFHVPSKKIDVVPILCFDNNLPDTPHDPSLVTQLKRIHNTLPAQLLAIHPFFNNYNMPSN